MFYHCSLIGPIYKYVCWSEGKHKVVRYVGVVLFGWFILALLLHLIILCVASVPL